MTFDKHKSFELKRLTKQIQVPKGIVIFFVNFLFSKY